MIKNTKGFQLLSQQSVQQAQEEDQASRKYQKQSQSDTSDFSPSSDMPDFNPSPDIPDFNPSPEIPEFNPSPDIPDFNPSPDIPDFNPSPDIPDFNPSPDIPDFNPGSDFNPPSNSNPNQYPEELKSPHRRSENGRPLKTPVNKRKIKILNIIQTIFSTISIDQEKVLCLASCLPVQIFFLNFENKI